MRITSKIGVIIASCAFLVAITAPVLAVSENGNRVNAQNRPSVTPSKVQAAVEQKEAAKQKLEAGKLERCKQRETKINNIILRIADRGQKQLELFTTISTKVQNFATDKSRQPENYDDLVAAVDAKKLEAEKTLTTIKESTVTFSCDSTDPKGAVAGFKESLKAEIAALKAYKTAVKNLIVGVKSANKSASPSVTPSIAPTTSPSPTTNNTTEGVQ